VHKAAAAALDGVHYAANRPTCTCACSVVAWMCL